MKKTILILGTCILLAGCSKLEENIPFLKKMDDTAEEQNNQLNDEIGNKGGNNHTGNKNSSNPGQLDDSITLKAKYFNQVKQVDGKYVIQNPANVLALVNHQFGLPSTYAPNDLVRPKVAFSFGNQNIEKSYLRKKAAAALEKMFAEAKKQNIELYAVSGYRSYERQEELFHAEINRVGKEKAVQAVAVPGTSEHQTGLAVDISSKSVNLDLTEQFGTTPEGKWLVKNAHKFGFILRYPKDKESITGYQYEPWHFRYVGTKAAKVIYEKNLTLEEYFDIVEKI
ncbi:serine-type D-Ala-D-Ala carboxypeptidase [Bacillus methanolicus PB1]|uniref:Serine-type D-Ala-D-Ala carboxypeptidase n=1 Tax=Bacillus methanolicus PB1 TaxID=997296 RepID=I3DWB0_BACMT|nr:D-Ala-D-Ala carboxypeptidase VanY [Bacillus methanolicus]EIJ78531.1 serine-type D-Ala-D-Ala carboxypeptidase [Bacillus methanolicus PB1]